jgi:hypothetical protein
LEARHEVYQRLGEDYAEDGDRGEERQHEGEDGVGEVLGVFFAVFGDTLDEERTKAE